MTKHEILCISEYGAVDSWTWAGTLSILGDGQYTFLLEQVPYSEYSTSHSLEQFSTGDELVDIIDSAWAADHFEGLGADEWQEVVQNIAEIDQALALEVIQAREEPEEPEPTPEVQWATWEPRARSQWAGIAEGMRGRYAILQYVRQCRELPTGVHHIRVDCPPQRHLSQAGVFERDVTFSDQ